MIQRLIPLGIASVLAGCVAVTVLPSVSQATGLIPPITTQSTTTTVLALPQQIAQSSNSSLGVVGQDGAFLGWVSSNRYDSQSICNQYGQYGSPYSAKSVLNQYGQYGSRYSVMGAYNPIAQKPPILVRDGQPIAFLTKNPRLRGGIDPDTFLLSVCGQ
jgi:hypothetical protein